MFFCLFALNVWLGSFICSVVFNYLRCFRSLIFMKYMFITKCSALVYMSNFVCGLKMYHYEGVHGYIDHGYGAIGRVGCHGGHCTGAKADSNLLFRALSP